MVKLISYDKARKIAFILAAILLLALIILSVTKAKHADFSQQTTATPDGVPLPIIMYHALCDDSSKTNDYTATPQMLESDVKAVLDAGFTPVFISEVIDFVHCGKPLPPKPIVFTFDDGFKGLATFLPPILEKYDLKVNIAIVGSFSEKAAEEPYPTVFSYLNSSEITGLFDTGRVEILNHSYNMHTLGKRQGTLIMEGESYADYRSTLLSDLQRCQDFLAASCHIVPRAFAYPYGYRCEAGERIIKSGGFLASLTCEERVNYITSDPESLYNLGRFNRSGSMSNKQLMHLIG